jgi:hypothetical protein
MKRYKKILENAKEQVEKLMKDWWWNSSASSRDKAIKILKRNPDIREESIQQLESKIGTIKKLKIYQHESPDSDSISYTLSKGVAERFADESGGDVEDYIISRDEIFYYTGNSEKELFVTWDI